MPLQMPCCGLEKRGRRFKSAKGWVRNVRAPGRGAGDRSQLSAHVHREKEAGEASLAAATSSAPRAARGWCSP